MARCVGVSGAIISGRPETASDPIVEASLALGTDDEEDEAVVAAGGCHWSSFVKLGNLGASCRTVASFRAGASAGVGLGRTSGASGGVEGPSADKAAVGVPSELTELPVSPPTELAVPADSPASNDKPPNKLCSSCASFMDARVMVSKGVLLWLSGSKSLREISDAESGRRDGVWPSRCL